MPASRVRSCRAAASIGIVALGALSWPGLTGCVSDSSTTEPAASAAAATSLDASPGSGQCATSARYGDEGKLYGRDWLLAYKQTPTNPDVTLIRCHYVHTRADDGAPSVLPSPGEAVLSGDLVPPPAFVTDGGEVQRILVSIPDATDRPLWRCPSTIVTAFDEYAVLDGTGTPVASFQIAAGGSPCGMFHVIPSA